eukprot:CAMPEP_0195077268 /NCGR_PEP_ID=MMETSP0448-20130528/19740_1 /TAXON_ID=66468 /ORGANISM="Heterocapsa triquestra, Strain CCMP 448" /LENGTH=95 /DNA_ID=CAMNT_0040109885 /DNA_START=75 /DNA_END=359 /DNA_ORIENTATION=+
MFDHAAFWRTGHDPAHRELVKENDLIPPEGYYTSPYFTKYPDEEFGVKRYLFVKPDGTEASVVMKVYMRHVLPLMRYTHNFKLNVSTDALELKAK